MQDSREIDYFGQRILQIVQPIALSGDRGVVLARLAESIASNFAADGCWVLQYPSLGIVRVAASAYFSHRAQAIEHKLSSYVPPEAATPSLWRMPLLPDYQVMTIDLRDEHQVTGCLVLATKGVEWHKETKLVFQIVSEYVSTALLAAELSAQARISEIYPTLHHRLTQAIVEQQSINRLFEIAVGDMVNALQLKRGLVLTLKSSESTPSIAVPPTPKRSTDSAEANDVWGESSPSVERIAASTVNSTPSPATAKSTTQVQIVTAIDIRTGNTQALPQNFEFSNSKFCQTALANAPNPTIFDCQQLDPTPTDRQIFQDDLLPSIAMMPLMGATTANREPTEAVWGWLVLQHDRSRHWHPVELKLLQCQIYQIALARIHRKSLQQARANVANRTSQVQVLLQIQTKLLADARNQMERLRQANELKDEFINTIGHELRTPLTSMSLAIEMLRQPEIEPDRHQQYLDILSEQCQREIELVSNLLKMQQLESKQLNFRPQTVSLDLFITEQANFVTERWKQNKFLELSLHLPPVSPQIETDAESLKHIIEELLVNAGKFALPQTTIELWVAIENQTIAIQIANLSKPIASEDLPYLFDKFRRGAGVTQQAIAGTGFGLSLVKALVEHIQGEIAVTSKLVGEGVAKTTFTLKLPLTNTRP